MSTPASGPPGEEDPAAPGPAGRLTRARAVLLLLALSVLVLVTGALPWTDAVVTSGLGGLQQLSSSGGAVQPVAPALGLVALAGAGALSIARRLGAVVALVVVALAGVGVVVAAVDVLADPLGAAAAEVGRLLAVTAGSVQPQDADVAVTAWPWVAAAAGAGLVVASVPSALAARGWRTGRRFETPAVQQDTGTGASAAEPGLPGTAATADELDPAAARLRARGEAFDAWDALSRGDDPTGAHAAGPRGGADPVPGPGGADGSRHGPAGMMSGPEVHPGATGQHGRHTPTPRGDEPHGQQ